jgi:predicted nuclease of predicted toxin-antitoxin system
MKFLIDAQLPRRFCLWITAAGHEALHTLDLPSRNCTTDNEILDLAEQQDRIVITKDDDFVQSYLLNGRPAKLLLVSTGNISNAALENVIRTNLAMITGAFETHHYLEIGRESLVIHE